MNFWIYFKTKLFEWKEQKKVAQKFYHNTAFQALDQKLLKSYSFANPYHICKRYLKKQFAKEIYAYGETPLTTMENIARLCELSPRDCVIEMGAGRGRAALFLAEYIGCRVKAYEQVPQFVEKMHQTVASKNLEMLQGNMFQANFSDATVIYLYGTLLEDEEIQTLCDSFPLHVKIITVSYPLNAYHEDYITKTSFSVQFCWGETEVYLNERTSQ